MKVLLIHPPVRVDHDPLDIPAGLAILTSISMNEGHQTALLDLNIERTSSRVKTINATEGGAIFGKGIECMKLKEFLSEFN